MGLSWSTFLFEVVNFVLFLWLLQRLLYAPLQRAVSERRAQRREAEEKLAELQRRAQELEREQDETRRELVAARQQASEQARAEAQQERARLLERAQGELLDLRRREEERLTLERRELAADVERQSLHTARACIESLLGRLGVAPLNDAMMQRLLEQLEHEGRPDVPQDVQAELHSASELDAAQQARIRDSLRPTLGSDRPLVFTIEPQLVAGMTLRVGDHVYDASLKTQLDALVSQAERQLATDSSAAL